MNVHCSLQGRNTYLTAELRAGIVAFLTICYIIAVGRQQYDLACVQHAVVDVMQVPVIPEIAVSCCCWSEVQVAVPLLWQVLLRYVLHLVTLTATTCATTYVAVCRWATVTTAPS
jgi:hypothetical protein